MYAEAIFYVSIFSIVWKESTRKFQYKMPRKAVWTSMKNPLLTIYNRRHRSLLELYCERGAALVNHRQKTFLQQRR